MLNDVDETENETEVKEWTEEETKKLLEALEIYTDSWERIALHVGRTMAECAQRFVELPLDDPEIELHTDFNPDNTSIFADGSNPIMRQAAFIASLVSPDVASVAAKAALSFMRTQERTSHPLNTKPAFVLNDRVMTRYGEGNISKMGGNKVEVDTKIGSVEAFTSEISHIFDEAILQEPETEDEIERLRSLASGALGASASNANSIALRKEKTLQSLLRSLIFLELEKIRVKTTQLGDLWGKLKKERHGIELTRKILLKERLELTQQMGNVKRRTIVLSASDM